MRSLIIGNCRTLRQCGKEIMFLMGCVFKTLNVTDHHDNDDYIESVNSEILKPDVCLTFVY